MACGTKADFQSGILQMKIKLREDLAPDPDFYYHQQFQIYHEPYLIWDKETWETALSACSVYQIEADGRYAGDLLLEDQRKDTKYILDFGLLPEYQGKGVGKAVVEQFKKMGGKFTAVTRKETLGFFLKSGFVLRRTIRDYYRSGVDGYFIVFDGKPND